MQDYIDKISALDGVGGVRVTPAWNGGGTVLCTIIDAEYNPASPTLTKAVQDTIDPKRDGAGIGIAPIGHSVTIDTPDTVTVNVTLHVELDSGYTWDGVKNSVENAVKDYLLELRQAWKNGKAGQETVVRISQIETRLLALTGIVDVGETMINNVAGNLTITNNDLPVIGVIARAEG